MAFMCDFRSLAEPRNGGLAILDTSGTVHFMTETLTVDENGQIILSEALRQAFGVLPGLRLRAEATLDRIEIVKDVPVVTETSRSPSGRLVLASTGIPMDAAKAVRQEREAIADRTLRR